MLIVTIDPASSETFIGSEITRAPIGTTKVDSPEKVTLRSLEGLIALPPAADAFVGNAKLTAERRRSEPPKALLI